MQTKRWYQSKTNWLNLFAMFLSAMPFINDDVLKAIGVTDTVRYLTIIGAITGMGNFMLRNLGNPAKITTQKPNTMPEQIAKIINKPNEEETKDQ